MTCSQCRCEVLILCNLSHRAQILKKKGAGGMQGNPVVATAVPRVTKSALARSLPMASGVHNTHSHIGALSNSCYGAGVVWQNSQALGLGVQIFLLPPLGQTASHPGDTAKAVCVPHAHVTAFQPPKPFLERFWVLTGN